MLFGVKANVGSNPTVTANEKDPGSLVRKPGSFFISKKPGGNFF
jgi:hypothetical protein